MNLDKNTIIGLTLMALVMLGFMAYERYTAPTQEEVAAWQAKQDSIRLAEVNKELKEKNLESQQLMQQATDSLNPLFAASQKQPGTTVLRNSLLSVTINNEGAQICRAELLDSVYRGKEGGNVILFDGTDNSFSFNIDGKQANIRTADLFFAPSEQTDSSVVMVAPIASGSLRISYSLVPNSYLVNVDVQALGLDGFFPSKTRTMDILWSQKMKQQEKGYDFENRYSTITYRDTDNDTNELSSMGGDEDETEFDERVKWVSFKTQFFSQILISEADMSVAQMKSEKIEKGEGYLKTLTAELSAPFDPSGRQSSHFAMYLGPNKFVTLSKNEKLLGASTDLDLRSLVYLGWPVIRWINRFFMIYLFDWLTG